MNKQAKVYLVGAGPGDPDLLTVKALRLIQNADTLVYDRLVSEEILQLVNSNAARIYVGKSTDCHIFKQEEINKVLVSLATNGKTVVRLKGGDPLIFGRGGEEAQELAKHGIKFEIVPGITSAQACATYAGVPLTHRGLARSVQFITGHLKENKKLVLDPAAISDPQQTLVIYMGLANLSQIVVDFVAAGRSAHTPATIIERGTTPRQRKFITTVGELEHCVERENIEAPAMIIIGEVVSLANELDWFEPWVEELDLKYG